MKRRDLIRELNKIGCVLIRHGARHDWYQNPKKAKAAKCLGNLGNAILAITDGKGNTDAFMARVRKEAEAVWTAAGIEWEDREAFSERSRKNYGDRTKPEGYEGLKSKGSSWQSLARGTGNIEAEQLNGDVAHLGRLLGIEVPYNALLWRLADEMAREGTPPGKYSAEDLMAMVKQAFDGPLSGGDGTANT